MDTKKPEALRLAERISDIVCQTEDDARAIAAAADSLCRQHAENQSLRSGYSAARLEIASLKTRVQELGQMARDVNSRRVVEVESQLAAIGTGGVEPLRPVSDDEKARHLRWLEEISNSNTMTDTANTAASVAELRTAAQAVIDADDSSALSQSRIEALRAALASVAQSVAAAPAQPAPAEMLVRYCPGCGSVGTVEGQYRDCCPDGSEARMIPQALAQKCRNTFRLAVDGPPAGARAGVLGQMARDVNSRRVVELESQLAAIGAGGVEPLRKRCLHQISEPSRHANPNAAAASVATEIPQFPGHPEPMCMDWSRLEICAIARYGREMYVAGESAALAAPAQAVPAGVIAAIRNAGMTLLQIEELARKHGATSYRNRSDTQHPAYGFTPAGLLNLVAEALAELRKQDHIAHARNMVQVSVEPDEVLVAIKRPEGYEDVHPALLAEECPALRDFRVSGGVAGRGCAMSRADIIAMAHEAGIAFVAEFGVASATPEWLASFAALVAAAEREECAQVCDAKAVQLEKTARDEGADKSESAGLRSSAWLVGLCADSIRARSAP